jgi:hypothetical protein
MPKTDWKEIDRMNAYCAGLEDFPAKGKCRYDFGKQRQAHDAYWDGWNEAAIADDRAKQGLPSDDTSLP